MWKEFSDFLNKGNVIDLAVAVILGIAFGAIVTSLVNDIIMPLIGVIIGGVNFTALVWQVGEAQIKYGNFLQALLNFLIIAFVLFQVVRLYNRMRGPKAAAPIPQDVLLLSEIRDLLKQRPLS